MSAKSAAGGLAAAGAAYWLGVILLPVVIAGMIGVIAAVALATIFPITLICAFFLDNRREALSFLVTAPACVGTYAALVYVGQYMIPMADWLSSVVAIGALFVALMTVLTLFMWVQLFIEGEGIGHTDAEIGPTVTLSLFCSAYWGLTIGVYYADTGRGFWG